MEEQKEQGAPDNRRSPLIMFAVAAVLGMFLAQTCAQQRMYRQVFFSEFGYQPDEEGHPLIIASRLQVLCYDYIAASRRAQAATQTVMPGGTIAGSDAEREQFIVDAIERLAKERAEQSRRHFIFSRQLAESVGPVPQIDGCRELITVEETP